MSQHASDLIAGVTPRYSMNWIVSRRVDLTCFIGAALLGYMMFGLHAVLHLNMVIVWFVWYTLLDSPHFFATYSRTYFDREEMKRRRFLLLGSLGLLGIGPAILLVSFGLYGAGVGWYAVPFKMLIAFVGMWAYWHVVRQHFGIMSLYRRKNDDNLPFDRWLDRWVLYIGLLAPLAAFIAMNEEARDVFGFPSKVAPTSTWEPMVIKLSAAAVALAVVALVARQIWRWHHHLSLNMPKLMFMAAVIPLHVTICFTPAVWTAPLLGFSAFVTIFHDVQYHAIVWYYQRNRIHKPDTDRKRFGLAAHISSRFPVYMCYAMTMGILFGLTGCLLQLNPGCIPVLRSEDIALFGTINLRILMYGVFLGVLMHHYFVDQFIWRPSKDDRLASELKLAKKAD